MPNGSITIAELVLTFLGAVAASSGFWIYLEKRTERKSLSNRLLKGLAHDRILDLGMKFIRKGWISSDEYENINDYLFIPYKEIGGDGSVTRIMCEVNKLPIKESKFFKKEIDCDEAPG